MYLWFGPSPSLVRTYHSLRMWQNWPGLQAGHLEWNPKPRTDSVFNLLPFAPSNHFFQDDQLIRPVELDCTQILNLVFSLSGIRASVEIVLQRGSVFLGGLRPWKCPILLLALEISEVVTLGPWRFSLNLQKSETSWNRIIGRGITVIITLVLELYIWDNTFTYFIWLSLQLYDVNWIS